MRSLKIKFDDRLTYELLLAAHMRARRGKRRTEGVLRVESNLEANLFMIIDALRDETYLPSAYKRFMVHEPKPRQILALPYVDRIIHQWVVEEFVKPYFVPRFITDSYACVSGRGTHAASDKLKQFMRGMRRKYPDGYYVVKMDIAKFFSNIDKDILYGILERRVRDEKLMRLIGTIIYDGELSLYFERLQSETYLHPWMGSNFLGRPYSAEGMLLFEFHKPALLPLFELPPRMNQGLVELLMFLGGG